MSMKNREPKKQGQYSLSLKLETTDKKRRNVDADDFFCAAEKWLRALKAFAKERGEHVTWEIVDLQKSSALVQVLISLDSFLASFCHNASSPA